MKPRNRLNLSLTHHLTQERLKNENTWSIVVSFLGGFLMLVTLFSDGFSDFIKEVKEKKNIAFPQEKNKFTKGRHSPYSSAQKADYLTLVFSIEISLVENNSVLWQTKKMLLRYFIILYILASENFLLSYYFLFNIRMIFLCLGDYKHFLYCIEVSLNLRTG